jgi:aminoglycoside phosphotransferase (APT) family kinase protein
MRTLSTAAVGNLAALHSLDLASTGLDRIGKPEGYVARQVEGWIGRYERAMTDDVPAMSFAGEWLRAHMPLENRPAFLHNDYKYDNLVLDPENPGRILCVLDWEMSTVGDPLMDLGTTLAYWTEAGDPAALKPFSLTWMPGNLTREEVVDVYAEARGIAKPDVLFHYVFGSYKVGVIVQQIFARYRKGLTKDPRFAGLGHVLRAASDNAGRAIRLGRIGNLYKP